MVILGIDPGSTRIGYGIISKNKPKLKYIDCGTINLQRQEVDKLILEAAKQLSKIIERHKPELIGIEKLYFVKNIKTGIEVSQTRGALILEIAKHKIPMKEFSPTEIKLATTSYGSADKKGVAKMVAKILNIKKVPSKYDDASDALAIAITTANYGSLL